MNIEGDTRKCGTCRWWTGYLSGGECRANAPVYREATLNERSHYGSNHAAQWPETQREHFCGAWEKRPESRQPTGENP